ncbi:adenylosuccinate lyase family protein [Diaminobutyricimonas sp. LJ205]|uniref:class-II fumarase/aspartase family protein n=1 Tax=Diaminobutyricimonas sp. LJ205 TaxID=2683590 RepID=UPI001E5C0586|nr:adenylosuccinate lyase family protein [Diaminobutyricimonas sp. LJ205]
MPSSDGADVGLLAPLWAGTAVVPVTGDAAIVAAMLEVEIALARVQAPTAAADAIEKVLREASVDPGQLAIAARGGGNPVIPLLAELRPMLDADSATWLHRGATSQDVVDSALVLVARDATRLVLADADAVIGSLAGLAEAHVETLMTGRTLTQSAIPTTFGLKAAGWLTGVVAATRQLRAAAGALPVQLGGAAGTLASFTTLHDDAQPIVDGLAEQLGLVTPVAPWHVQRHPITSLGDGLAALSDALGVIAANVSLLARAEIGELAEPSREGGGGSSAMPHKQNPVLSTLISSGALRAPSLAADLHRAAVTVDERPPGAWHSEWQVLRELLRTVGGQAETARELVGGLVVNADRMRQNLDRVGDVVISERVMLELGPVIGKGAVQDAVDHAARSGSRLRDILHAIPELADWSDQRLADLTDPAQYTGAAAAIIARAVADSRKDTN